MLRLGSERLTYGTVLQRSRWSGTPNGSARVSRLCEQPSAVNARPRRSGADYALVALEGVAGHPAAGRLFTMAGSRWSWTGGAGAGSGAGWLMSYRDKLFLVARPRAWRGGARRVIPAWGWRQIPWEVGVAQHPVLGYLVWAVLFGALFAWEGLALSHLTRFHE